MKEKHEIVRSNRWGGGEREREREREGFNKIIINS